MSENKNEKFWEYDHPQNKPVPTSDRTKDLFYMNAAKLVAKRSKCASRQIGTVLVKDDNIVSWGCNGSPPGVDLCQDVNTQCPRYEFGYKSGQGLHICPAQHAERNAILQAANNGISTKNTTLYCYCGLPCMECWKAIICAGISRVIYIANDAHPKIERDESGNLISYDQHGHLIRYDDLSAILASQSGIVISSYTEEEISNEFQ